jgi:guanylate kinase
VIDPQLASAIAVANRRARAAVKQNVASGAREPLDVAHVAWADRTSVEAGLRVVDLLGSLSGIGESKVAKILTETEISPRKRLGFLGVRQQKALTEWLTERGKRQERVSRVGRLIVVAGPTAVGKGTVVSRVRELYPAAQFSVSATTRAPRPGEIDGVHYYFVTPEQFDALVQTGQMLEWAVVHGENRYGTPRKPIVDALNSGQSIILEIDIQGARQVKAAMPSALLVFLLPPSWDELVRRLTSRATESDAEQQRRLETAQAELEAQDSFDITIVNDDVDRAAKAVVELLTET